MRVGLVQERLESGDVGKDRRGREEHENLGCRQSSPD